jgi:uncharacterized membrane protein YkoI
MHVRTLLFAALVGGSATSFAASATPVIGIGDAVAQLESRYPGTVVAIALDDSGDRPAHYHVDMRFRNSGLARLDVDAATLDVGSRETVALVDGSATLVYAAALVTSTVPGQMLAAQLDATNGAPHYDVDVRLPQGAIARLKVDPVSGDIGWRTPAVALD